MYSGPEITTMTPTPTKGSDFVAAQRPAEAALQQFSIFLGGMHWPKYNLRTNGLSSKDDLVF